MKQTILLVLLSFCVLSVGAERIIFHDSFDYMGEWRADSGDWIVENGMLQQKDDEEPISTISRIAGQKGIMIYEFDVSYLKGLEDKKAGFGIHIVVDEPTGRRSWGQNKSLLLWLTYDVEAYGAEGVYAQIYRSSSPTKMNLQGMEGPEFPLPPSFLPERLEGSLHVKFLIDTESGIGRLYNPLRSGYYVELDVGGPLGSGSYISLRTNSLALAFDNITVTMIE